MIASLGVIRVSLLCAVSLFGGFAFRSIDWEESSMTWDADSLGLLLEDSQILLH